jgi:16S rRNA (guanine(966)-N(2))-methyltransferase RsmD
MRIISGSLKGRRITAPKKLPVRPTTDRSKEALFNILTNWYEFSEIRVLDLFSGTGNISYEFGSRGVQDIVAVDQNKHCSRFIEQTATALGLNIDVVCKNTFDFLSKPHQSFDVIFADPPYDHATFGF